MSENKNLKNDEAVENYSACFDIVHPVADYVAVNISSPNTPNLRDLQRPDSLNVLLSALQGRNHHLGRKPLLVKISPDLTDDEIRAMVDVCLERGVDGIIATNTTNDRSCLKSVRTDKIGPGGLSGKPLADRSNEVISTVYAHSDGKLPIIGVGGILTGQDAFDKIRAGASLVQGYQVAL